MWRYSMAAVIVVAALLDVFWWVPQREARRAERLHEQDVATEPVRAQIPKCRAAQIKAEQARLQAEIDQLDADMKRLDAELNKLGADKPVLHAGE
jgi:hypothetical protein